MRYTYTILIHEIYLHYWRIAYGEKIELSWFVHEIGLVYLRNIQTNNKIITSNV